VAIRDELTSNGASPWQVMDTGDLASHRFIAAALAAARPDDAVLSEEGSRIRAASAPTASGSSTRSTAPASSASTAATTGPFHIALWTSDRLSAGAVSLPAMDLVFCTDPAPVVPPSDRTRPRLVTSRSRNPAVAVVVANALDADAVRLGSAGAKAMAVVTGQADIYVHDGGMYQWDSAAPAAVALGRRPARQPHRRLTDGVQRT
jgi:3'(2'), 5'-bisphosphate nucleotidase